MLPGSRRKETLFNAPQGLKPIKTTQNPLHLAAVLSAAAGDH